MSKAASSFKETNVKRLLRGIAAAGKEVASIELIEDGRIRVKLKNGDGAAENDDDIETAEDLRKLI
jgi:hypothetical protein